MWHGWWIIKREEKDNYRRVLCNLAGDFQEKGQRLAGLEQPQWPCFLCKCGCITPDRSVLTDSLSSVGVNPQTSADGFVQKEQSPFKNRNTETYKQEINSQRKDSIDPKLSFTLKLFSLQVNCSGVCPENHQEK